VEVSANVAIEAAWANLFANWQCIELFKLLFGHVDVSAAAIDRGYDDLVKLELAPLDLHKIRFAASVNRPNANRECLVVSVQPMLARQFAVVSASRTSSSKRDAAKVPILSKNWTTQN
jgi:hypothetical protein